MNGNRNKTENNKQTPNKSRNKASKWNDCITEQWTHFPQNWLVKIQTASNSSSTHTHIKRENGRGRERARCVNKIQKPFIHSPQTFNTLARRRFALYTQSTSTVYDWDDDTQLCSWTHFTIVPCIHMNGKALHNSHVIKM